MEKQDEDYSPVDDKFLVSVPVNNFAKEKGAKACLDLDFKWLSRQLKNGNVMSHSEIISQINLREDGITLFVSDKNTKPKE